MRHLLKTYFLWVVLAWLFPLSDISAVGPFTTLNEGFAVAQRLQKPVLLHFYATNCPPCAELDRGVLRNKEVVSELAKNWVVVRIDCTDEKPQCRAAADRYGVTAWPTWIFLDRDLKEVPSTRIVKWELKTAQVLSVLKKARD